jgi:hypothetical protein
MSNILPSELDTVKAAREPSSTVLDDVKQITEQSELEMSHTLQARAHCASRSPRSGVPADPNLRIGDADRERASSRLGQAFTLGYLSVEDYQDRLDQALQARTGGDLRALTADLPGHSLHRADPDDQAARQAAALRGVRTHLGIYLLAAAVTLSLWLVFALTVGAWYFWPIWPLAGGAAGVVSHAIPVGMGRRTRPRIDTVG